jgi:voltage-gated potassium channel
MDVFRQLKFGVSFLILALAGGTLGYTLIEGWHPLDSLYMTVITITTVGYGEVGPLSQAGRAFTMVLILGSVGMVAFIVVGLARVMVEGEVRRILGRRKLEKKIAGLKNHYIVCGYGRIGSYICKELAERPLPFVVVERDPNLTQRIEEGGYLYVNGDATDDDILRQAGIESAKCLVASVASDADNLYITFTARQINSNLYILSRATDDAAEKKLIKAGANKVVSPYMIGAHRMAMALLRPNVVDFMEIAMHRRSLELQLEEIRVHAVDQLSSTILRESGIRSDLDLIVVAIKKQSGKMIYNPSSETQIEAGDTLITLGERRNLDKLEKLVGFESRPQDLR